MTGLRFFQCILFLLLSSALFAQSGIDIDKLTDAQLIEYMKKAQLSGLDQKELERKALENGLTPADIAKLTKRINQLQVSQESAPATRNANVRPTNDHANEKKNPEQPSNTIFGSEYFSNENLAFEPNLTISTPSNYVLGPGDQCIIEIYGVSEMQYKVDVSPDGFIRIPSVGPIFVAGLSMEEARVKVKKKISTIYPTIHSGQTHFQMVLGNIKSIHVSLIGEVVKPGTYTISSLATIGNALYLSGGPTRNGSLRLIDLVRDGKNIVSFDFYDFLNNGNLQKNILLRDQDVIKINSYRKRVEISGAVKKPAIFELNDTDNLLDLVSYARGFTDNAFRSSMQLIRITDSGKQIIDIPKEHFITTIPNSGDKVIINTVTDKFNNRVSVSGDVERPGSYELTPGMRIHDLVTKAGGLLEDAFLDRAGLERQKEDLSLEYLAINLRKALQKDSVLDIPLVREDKLFIKSGAELRSKFDIEIRGEVRRPGIYPYIEGLSLRDLLLQANGLTRLAYPKRIEISRLIKKDTLLRKDVRMSELLTILNGNDLSLSVFDIKLAPFDVVIVRRLPGYEGRKFVSATGEFQFPGPYPFVSRNERVSDLIRRAGGFTPEADMNSVYINRVNEASRAERREIRRAAISDIQKSLKDSTGMIETKIDRAFDVISLNMKTILKDSGSSANLILKEGDELVVSKVDGQVKIRGEVYINTQMAFEKEFTIKDYILAGGGYTNNARKNKAYVIYPNGRVKAQKNFFLFKIKPAVLPGSTIVVPGYVEAKKRGNRLSTVEVVSISSALGSLALIMSTLFKK